MAGTRRSASRSVRQHERQPPALVLAGVQIRYRICQIALGRRDALAPKVGKVGNLVLKHHVHRLLPQDLRPRRRRCTVIEQCCEDLCRWLLELASAIDQCTHDSTPAAWRNSPLLHC